MKKVIGVIPCRYQSSRFPGKPLALIGDKPMMWHVYQRAIESNSLDEIYIATDDSRIEKAAIELDLRVVMTGNNHLTGTDRVAEVANLVEGDYYINIQGDEPFIEPEAIRAVTQGIVNCQDKEVVASNAYSKLNDTVDILSANVVKVIVDIDSRVLSYSRSPIPYPQSGHATYYRQLGLYGFTKKALSIFSSARVGPIEGAEQVEMYRLIEHGNKILMIETTGNSISVDTEYDLNQARNIFKEQ